MNLTSTLTKDTWFYEKHKEELEPYLGKPYLSYSTAMSYTDYVEDFVKQKLVGLPKTSTIYTRLGNFLGEAVETGEWGDNPDGFEGMESVNLERLRPENGEYEKLIIIDFGDWICIGFIDVYVDKGEEGVVIIDMKTGGKSKKEQYSDKDYTQVILYAHARELKGDNIKDTGVYFILREGSHVRPPLKLTKEQEYIPLEYNEKRVKYALNKLKKAAKGIDSLKTTYDKFFT